MATSGVALAGSESHTRIFWIASHEVLTARCVTRKREEGTREEDPATRDSTEALIDEVMDNTNRVSDGEEPPLTN